MRCERTQNQLICAGFVSALRFTNCSFVLRTYVRYALVCSDKHSDVAPQYQEVEEVGRAVEQLSALERLTRAEMLPLVRSLSSQLDALRADGCRSIASWLSMRLGISHASARDLEAVAVATASLPHVLAAFVSGSLSWDKLVL